MQCRDNVRTHLPIPFSTTLFDQAADSSSFNPLSARQFRNMRDLFDANMDGLNEDDDGRDPDPIARRLSLCGGPLRILFQTLDNLTGCEKENLDAVERGDETFISWLYGSAISVDPSISLLPFVSCWTKLAKIDSDRSRAALRALGE